LCFGAQKRSQDLRIDLAMLWDDPFGEQEDELAGELDEQNEDGEVPHVHGAHLSRLFWLTSAILSHHSSSLPTRVNVASALGVLLPHVLTILLFSLRLHHLFDRLPKVHVRAERPRGDALPQRGEVRHCDPYG
jgi:hypothetical protein